jgi:glycerol-3-phosphate dehydrogenase
MQRNLDALTKTAFDLVVIGGGVNGSATAREAALRGLKVALLEARDFASGTSSRSSKLIHGGLRYLQQYDFALVHESRHERRLLFELAPHLAKPLPIVLPVYRGDPHGLWKLRLGLTVYDLFGNLGRQDRHRMLSREETLHVMPALHSEGLRGAAIYHDSQTDDARLTLEFALGAAECGAVVVNHAAVRAFGTKPGNENREIISAEVEDRLAGRRIEVHSRFWVNLAGPWVDEVRALLPGFDGSHTVRLSKGSHVILPQASAQFAVLAFIPPHNCVFCLWPWNEQSLLGSTDTDYEGDPELAQPNRADTDYLLGAANRVLQQPYRQEDIRGTFTGVRALVFEAGRASPAVTRDYRFHEDRWAKNLITVCGGKLTTARALGEKLIDRVVGRLGVATPQSRSSRNVIFPGGRTGPYDAFVKSATQAAVREFGVPPAAAERIVRTYGSRWRAVLEAIRQEKSLAEPLGGSPALLTAEVKFAIQQEMAMTLEDFFLRRSGLNWWGAWALADAMPAVAKIFAAHFGWSEEEKRAAVEAFRRAVPCLVPRGALGYDPAGDGIHG